eukprot:3651018-Alexandrium_andersonii.AAC.1
MDPNLVTQLSADGAQAVGNLLDPEAEQPPPRSESHLVDRGAGPDSSPAASQGRADAVRHAAHAH